MVLAIGHHGIGLFGYDPPGKYQTGNLGWCEAGFCPAFEEKYLAGNGGWII
jgi:hypothetical protein